MADTNVAANASIWDYVQQFWSQIIFVLGAILSGVVGFITYRIDLVGVKASILTINETLKIMQASIQGIREDAIKVKAQVVVHEGRIIEDRLEVRARLDAMSASSNTRFDSIDGKLDILTEHLLRAKE